jgi:predicted dehydrogenase
MSSKPVITPHSRPISESAPLRLGVLGASRIVSSALCEGASPRVRVCALASRDAERAHAFTERLGISKAFGSYTELVDDPEIEAVYIALPAAFHYEWCRRALLAGKHVLCEKPFSLSLAQAQRAVSLAQERGLLLMEAHHWRYHPLVKSAQQRIHNLGELRLVEASFKVGLNNPGDIRLNPSLGPGVMMDFGCYAIQWCDYLIETSRGGLSELPSVVSAELIEGERGVDLACEVELDYAGIRAKFSCDMRDQIPFRAYMRAEAEGGSFHFENPLGVAGSSLSGVDGEEFPSEAAQSTYQGQLDAFVQGLSDGVAPPTSGATILRTQATLDAVYEKSGLPSRTSLSAWATG